MRKILTLLILLIGIVFPSSAELRIGPTAGINISDFHFKQKLVSTHQGIGAGGGLLAEFMIPGIGFGVDFGLKYNAHSSRLDLGQYEVWAVDDFKDPKVWMHNIQIPVNLRFKYTRLQGVERYVAPFVYAGPVFDIMVGHNDCQALEYSGGYVSLQCGLGAELFRKFQISAGYYWGMTYEIRTVKLDNYSARPQGWVVNMAYLFDL